MSVGGLGRRSLLEAEIIYFPLLSVRQALDHRAIAYPGFP